MNSLRGRILPARTKRCVNRPPACRDQCRRRGRKVKTSNGAAMGAPDFGFRVLALRTFALGSLALCGLAPLPAHAATPGELDAAWSVCNATDPEPAERIARCSTVIASGKLNDLQIAIAYASRGFARSKLKDHAEAVADFDMSLAHKRDYAAALYGRGLALMDKGELARALTDFDRAITLRPDIAKF